MISDAAIGRKLTTPRSAALAGIVFSVLLSSALLLIRLSVPHDLGGSDPWLLDPTRRRLVGLAVNMIPFAGIAFLWFIGVIRDRVGEHEDRFFATVLFGSGLLFVAMLFASGAIAASLRLEAATAGTTLASSDTWRLDARITQVLLNVYALRMAAVFMISVATISLRTGVVSRWLAIAGYGCAAILLVTIGVTPWVQLLFPAWIFVLSVHILVRPGSAA